ncbi:YpbF [Bacillus atrophaeus UCMB-5137]|uniref:YpbF family protein n=1 Tax=Bacillus atrophaeus TaxID=1452 RepID=UPI00032ECBCE|nr:YpbF family protein [Bacillus atrophaeus]AKL84972.1 YpbF [Bacillus atrophaeus UCMB-5137]
MERIWDQLDRFTDAPTKQMLQALVKRKVKYENYAKQCRRWQWTSLISFGLLCLFFIFKGFSLNQQAPQIMLEEFLNHTVYLFWMMAAAFAYCTSYYFKKKEEKAEGEYHKLRCEIIQKSTDLWPQPEKWKARESVFQMMKHQYDINLYFESK